MQISQSVLDFFTAVLQDETLKEQFAATLGSQDTLTIINLAKGHGYDFTANELRQGLKHIHSILPNLLEIENLTVREYRCTRNASYSHDCIGRDDLTARQGYYIHASSTEQAWEKMAIRFPQETTVGFTVQYWEGFNVAIESGSRDL